MSDWLPWAVLGFIMVLLAAMPWRRPHPNHEFMFHMWRMLEDPTHDEQQSRHYTENRVNE